MAVYRPVLHTDECQTISDRVWRELYRYITTIYSRMVYSSGATSWHGQEHDIADDILQEAVICAMYTHTTGKIELQ